MTLLAIETISYDPEFTNNVSYGLGPYGHLSEVVTIDGTPATESYKVRLHRAEDGVLFAETYSAPGSGVYTFTDLPMETDYVPVVIDHNKIFKAVAAGPITPTLDS